MADSASPPSGAWPSGPHRSRPLVAVDIGNTRIKVGVFLHDWTEPISRPQIWFPLDGNWTSADVDAYLPDLASAYDWVVASVNRPSAARLAAWLGERKVTQIRKLTHTDIPLAVALANPAGVGVDRLATALAANRLRDPQQNAIVVNSGTALTVDLVDTQGVFRGGAILPGIDTSARALHEFTDALPLVDVPGPPPAVGESTIAAIRSGLYWGAVGAVRELIERFGKEYGACQVFLTGGAGPLLASVLAEENPRPPLFVPDLTLSGIALAARHVAQSDGGKSQ